MFVHICAVAAPTGAILIGPLAHGGAMRVTAIFVITPLSVTEPDSGTFAAVVTNVRLVYFCPLMICALVTGHVVLTTGALRSVRTVNCAAAEIAESGAGLRMMHRYKPASLNFAFGTV